VYICEGISDLFIYVVETSPYPRDRGVTDYKTFVLALINGKQFLGYNEVSSALVNHELRRKAKSSLIVYWQKR